MSTAHLRQLFESRGVIRLIGAHNALGARLAERAGFDGVWSSGLEISTSYAVPDANILTMSEVLAATQSMVDAVRLPIVADCDTGFGNSNNVIRTVRKFESAGVAAICLEDKQFPKVNSFIPGRQELAPIAEFVGKLIAAKSAQKSADFMLIARTEALIAGLGVNEALKRANAYVEAGADAILVHSKSASVEPIVDFMHGWASRAPVVVVPTTYYSVTAAELEALGIKMVVFANYGVRAAVGAMLEVYGDILANGSAASVEHRVAPLSLLFDLQGMPQMKEAEEAYLRDGRPLTRAVIPAAGDHLAEASMKEVIADVPIPMLDLNGKPLLQRQLEVLAQNGVTDVTVVAGYQKEKVAALGAKLVYNLAWAETGEMQSISCAATNYQGRTLVAYADIVFDGEAIRKLLASDADISVLVDRSFDARECASGRRPDLVVADGKITSRRSLDLGTCRRVVRIGKSIPPDEAQYEFAGLALFSETGLRLLMETYAEAVSEAPQSPFQEASSIERASLTDLLQELIDRGCPVTCVEVASGWLEIRSIADYRLASQLVSG